jgi:hypothetical protein
MREMRRERERLAASLGREFAEEDCDQYNRTSVWLTERQRQREVKPWNVRTAGTANLEGLGIDLIVIRGSQTYLER